MPQSSECLGGVICEGMENRGDFEYWGCLIFFFFGGGGGGGGERGLILVGPSWAHHFEVFFCLPKIGVEKMGEKEGLRWKFTYLPLSYPNVRFFFFFQCNVKSPIVLSKVLLDSHHSLLSTRRFQSMHLT